MTEKNRRAWAVEFIGSPLSGGKTHFAGNVAAPYVRLFDTRKQAREWLADERARNRWAFNGHWAEVGGTRVYQAARVVPVAVTVRAA